MKLSQKIVSLSAILAIIAAGCNKPAATTGGGTPNPVPSGMPGQPVAAAGPWTMDVAQLAPPSTPVTGRIAGQEFKPDKIEFKGENLVLRQGKDFFADKEIEIWLTDRESYEGLTIEVRPDQGFTNTPHIHMGAKKPGGNLPDTQMFMEKYAMKLEFGKVEGGKLPGTIYLCLPDKDKSYVAGSFSVDATALTAAKITGKIALPARTESIKLQCAYLGHDTAGKPHSGYVGFTMSPKAEKMSASSFASKLESTGTGLRYRHGQVLPGTYLVLVNWDQRSMAWRWLEVKGQGTIELDFAVEAGGTGEVDVSLPAGSKERRVSLLPLDADGKLPAKAGDASHLAMQLSNYVHDMSAEAPAGRDKVTFSGLRPGTYRVFAGKATADVVIKPGAKTTAQLK